MSQDPRTFNKEDKVTWDELAVSLQQLITQIKTDLANEIIDRKTVCEKLQKEIDALFDKDGHLVFPNGNTIWIDANNGTLPSTGTGSVTEVSDVTFDQLDSNMQDRLNDDKVGIAQALSENEELKKSIQANADEITKLITQIKTDLANEIIDRKAVCEKLQKEIDALFDKDGHLVFPNGNTIWIDANNGTLPSTGTGTGTGSGVTKVSDVTFDQLDSNMQDRLNDDNVGIAQALSEIEELKKSIQANADEITKLKAQLAASGAAAAAGGGGLFVDYPSGICVASGRNELSYEFTAAENCAISITCDYGGARIAGTFTGTLRVNATATSLGPNTLAGGFLFFKKGDTVMIALTASNPESTLSIIQYKLRKSSSGIKLNFSGKVTYYGRKDHDLVVTIPEDGFITAGAAGWSDGNRYVKINGVAICDDTMVSDVRSEFRIGFGSVPVSKGDTLTCNTLIYSEKTVVYFFPLAH